MTFESFFMMEVPIMLKKLTECTAPKWGVMTAPEMIEHLRKGIELSLMQLDIKVITPEELLPQYREFILSDKSFKPGAQKPREYDLVPGFEGDLEERKISLLKSLVTMMTHFEKHPDFVSIHPSFGTLNTNEWMHLHKKHILLHFKQFGLT